GHRIDDDDLAGASLGRQRVAQRQGADLLGQVNGVAARGRAEGATTTTELRRLAIAVASAARALLLDELPAGEVALGTVLDVVRASHRLELLVAHHAVQDVLPHFEAENIVLEGDGTVGLAVEGGYLEFHYFVSPATSAAALN